MAEQQTRATHRRFHPGLSIIGPLRNWNKREWQKATKYITRQNGERMTAEELRSQFVDLLANGVQVMPLGKPCEGWSDVTGCPGHEVVEGRP